MAKSVQDFCRLFSTVQALLGNAWPTLGGTTALDLINRGTFLGCEYRICAVAEVLVLSCQTHFSGPAKPKLDPPNAFMAQLFTSDSFIRCCVRPQ